jgi:3,2-trans-enoyl-CoA isomerase
MRGKGGKERGGRYLIVGKPKKKKKKKKSRHSQACAFSKLTTISKHAIAHNTRDRSRPRNRARARSRVKGLVLCSGPDGLGKVFSAGLDFECFAAAERADLARFWTALQDAWLALFGTHLATVAAVTGQAPAGGCLLAMSCDARVMSLGGAKVSTIGLNETKIGLVAPPFFMDTMVHTIGTRQTEKMLTYGSLVDAVEAKRIGLVDETVERDEVMPRSIAALDELIAIPDGARRATKMLMRQAALKRLTNSREADVEEFISTITSPPVQKMLGQYMAALAQRKAKAKL